MIAAILDGSEIYGAVGGIVIENVQGSIGIR